MSCRVPDARVCQKTVKFIMVRMNWMILMIRMGRMIMMIMMIRMIVMWAHILYAHDNRMIMMTPMIRMISSNHEKHIVLQVHRYIYIYIY